MFTRSSRGLLDFTAALLCLWAAAWHTPAGALVRAVAARLTSSTTTARPLLAYYSGGVYDSAPPPRPGAPQPAPVEAPVVAALPPSDALGLGVVAALGRASPPLRRHAEDVARRFHRESLTAALDAAQVAALAGAELGSDEAGVLSLFAGWDVARFATERVRAEGRVPTLEALAGRLPPGSPALVSAGQALAWGTAYGLAWPVAPGTRVTSGYGWRSNPVTGTRQLHGGLDLAVPEGTAVHAVAAGVVRRASEDAVNGRIVIIDHGRGVWTAYCHNSVLQVTVGQRLERGQVLALSGSTGRSTGPHVHYQLELSRQPVDPLPFRAGSPEAPP